MSVVISLLNMKAPPSPSGRRSGTVEPPLGDLEVSFRPDSPTDSTLSGDSHGPTLVNGSATSDDLTDGHYEIEEAIVENKIPAESGLVNWGVERAQNGTTQFNDGHNGIPNMVNRGNNSPTLLNGDSNSIPLVVNGGNNSPTMMNGSHNSIPNQVNGGNNGPAMVNSVSHHKGLQSVNGNENRTAPMARNYVKEQNMVNGFGRETFPFSVPFSDIPTPRRKLSADSNFFFPEPRHIQFSSSSVGRDSPVLSSQNSAPSHSNHSSPRESRRLERHCSVLPEGEEGEEDEDKGTGGGGGGSGGEGERPAPHNDTQDEMEKISRALGDMSPFVRQHLHHVENRFFEMFGDKEKQTININKFLTGLTATGMRHSDPRLKETFINLKNLREKSGSLDLQAVEVDYDTFMTIISDNLEVLVKAFSSSFIIPDFHGFCNQLDQIYNSCLSNTTGKVASYIPQLARSKPDYWAMSVCTVDGQRYSLGDINIPFTLQSCSKPLTYAMALGLNGTDSLHSFIGMEPSGRYFNELCLDYSNKPHNPMINAGAIMTAALVKPELSAADRFDFVFNMYKRLAGDEHLGFNNAVFLSEKECADRNFALAYFMRENKCFPAGTRLHETLDFYFQLCSLEITAESGAVMAATLANGGLNPLTGDPVLTVDAVRNTLTLMHSCGMYNYSGQFAFKVGLPSKSGVSGCVLLVVPNTMGICLWSPPLDTNGNSCRAVQFCMELVSRFNFHNFDNLRGHFTTKIDPRTVKAESTAQILFDLLFSAAAGDLSALRRHSLSGTDMEAQDYDGRTALHVATSEGHVEIVEYLIQNCQVYPLPKDRWGRTPLDDAISFCQPMCAALIKDSCKKKGLELPSGVIITTPTTAPSNPLPTNN